MRKLFLLIGAVLLSAAPVVATVVSGTVKDVNGLAYSSGSLTVTLVTPIGASGAYLNGAQVQGIVGPVLLDTTGSFLVSLADNTLIQCANAQGQLVACAPQTKWSFAVTLSPGVPPPTGTGPQTCPAGGGGTALTISGASQSVSASFSACPALSLIVGGASPSFSAITSGTNTTAAMVVGTGASLGVSGSGTIAATSAPFSGLTSGTNTTAAMTCGTGCALASVPQFNIGAVGTNGVLGLNGTTSGTATFTAPAVAGTSTNAVAMTNILAGPNGAVGAFTYGFNSNGSLGMFASGASLGLVSNSLVLLQNFSSGNQVAFANTAVQPTTNTYTLGDSTHVWTNVVSSAYSSSSGNLLISSTAPTIAAGGCGGAAASISVNNGTASFNINVGTTPTAPGCTVTLPAATTGWNCSVNDFTTISTTVFVQKQTASTTTSAVFQNFNDVAVAAAPTASDIYHVSCFAN